MTSNRQVRTLAKHHGLGNDFLIHFVDQLPEEAPALARALCHRTEGIGADGLIFGLHDGARHQFVLFNADGGRAEISGNGMRCFGQALAMAENTTAGSYEIITDAGVKNVEVRLTDAPVGEATVDMGEATVGPAVDGSVIEAAVGAAPADSVDIGNPHIVVAVAAPLDHDMAIVGPAIEQAYLPTGANVHLIAVDEDARDSIRMSIWERGVGVTEACGSGACAAAVVANRWGLVGSAVTVSMPGGNVGVRLDVADGITTVELTGPTAFVGSIDLPANVWELASRG